MKEETKKWIKRAERDLRTAKNDIKSKDYYATSFWCQQAAEKALKAVILEKKGELIKIHDLVELAKKSDAPEYILQLCKDLTPVYTETRYPDWGDESEFKKFNKKEAEEDIKITKRIIAWIKKNL